MKKEELKKEFIKWCDEPMSTDENDREEMFEKIWQEGKETLIAEIEKLKEETQEETGAFKYNFAYDEVIDLINHRPTCDDAT